MRNERISKDAVLLGKSPPNSHHLINAQRTILLFRVHCRFRDLVRCVFNVHSLVAVYVSLAVISFGR